MRGWGLGASALLLVSQAQAGTISATVQPVATEVMGLTGLFWIFASVLLIIFGVYEAVKWYMTREFGAGATGIVSFILAASMLIFVVPQFQQRAAAYGATLDQVQEGMTHGEAEHP